MKKAVILGVSAAALTTGLGLGAVQLANADNSASPTPSASATATTTTGKGATKQEHSDKGQRGGKGLRVDTAKLAEKLGVSEDKLTKAIDAARQATRPAQNSQQDSKQQGTREDKQQQQAAFAKELASQLGIDEAKVTSALAELRTAAEADRKAADQKKLDEAVSSGKLTQAEADAVRKAIDAGIVSAHGGGRR